MSAFGMHPSFTNKDQYRAWRRLWRLMHARQVADARKWKRAAKLGQRHGDLAQAAKFQKSAAMQRPMGRRLMTLLDSARARWTRIVEMQAQLAAQRRLFPLDLGTCQVVDFHFNRGVAEFPDILPMWVVKAKGQTFYLPHVEFQEVSFSTRELPTGSTRGMLRVRHCQLRIEACGTAYLSRAA